MIFDVLVLGGVWLLFVLFLFKCVVVKFDKVYVWFFLFLFVDILVVVMVVLIFEGNLEESFFLCEEYIGDEDLGLYYNYNNYKYVL